MRFTPPADGSSATADPAYDPGAPRSAFVRRGRLDRLLYWRGHDIGWVLPVLIGVTGSVVELTTPDWFRASSWLVLVSGTAAALCGVRTTVLLVVLSLLAYGVLTVVDRPMVSGWPVLVLLVVGGVLSVLACAVRVTHAAELLRLSVVADTTRRAVLRPLPPGLGGLEHAELYLPADSEARVGGDFYDIQPSPWGTRVLIGDVQGKGLEVVEIAAALLGTFREAAYHERCLATVASRLEIRLKRQVAYRLDMGDEQDGDRFATAVMLGFPADEPDVLELVNFGHEPPLLIDPSGGTGPLPGAHGLPLGMSDIADRPPPVLRVTVPVGATLLLTTDGVTEARNEAGTFYPLREEVTRAAARRPEARRPRAVTRFVRDGVLLHTDGRLEDDTTIFSVRRPGPDEQPPWRQPPRPPDGGYGGDGGHGGANGHGGAGGHAEAGGHAGDGGQGGHGGCGG
ncbi:PP2C family protein-serine/threonine phosphatase [Streptomyces sp. MJP52]|uniref:PP2C family protein-serine/threonine phosphatase n=1 Tax=Streptomyces sp. MJP52 TaxID=2940555 RepID=UPI002477264F|nr:PP2C family protein-serine/threonine phosphatase [Streptomyces sp. MJP52]MDH6225933.1 serine phosphatase RsbU (regulator of sigma subunit) [Streptomyces sp. MJP52]